MHVLLVEGVGKEFHMPATTVDALLVFYQTLNHQGLILIAE